ncbi:MAG: hypothetical protein ACYS5F_14145 [Planctomycetota bacterium]|jgi:hypothetical protein
MVNTRGTSGAPQNIYGVVTGSASALQFPDELAIQAKIQARAGNLSIVSVGNAVDNTVFEIQAGETTEWFEVNNLNHLWYSNPSGTADAIVWWVQR